MKIKSIAAICKKNKQVVLFNRYSDSGTLSQYIGDGNAVYPISGLPELDEESILTIFDVPEKQREDWLVRYRDIPEGISFEDTDATEKIIEQGNLSIVYSGKTLKPLQTRRGLVFIESRYLSPVSDVLDVLELYERVTPFGAPYIVAKAGFLLQAVIMPCDVIRSIRTITNTRQKAKLSGTTAFIMKSSRRILPTPPRIPCKPPLHITALSSWNTRGRLTIRSHIRKPRGSS